MLKISVLLHNCKKHIIWRTAYLGFRNGSRIVYFLFVHIILISNNSVVCTKLLNPLTVFHIILHQ